MLRFTIKYPSDCQVDTVHTPITLARFSCFLVTLSARSFAAHLKDRYIITVLDYQLVLFAGVQLAWSGRPDTTHSYILIYYYKVVKLEVTGCLNKIPS